MGTEGDNHLVIAKYTGSRNGKSKQEYTQANLRMIYPEDVIIELEKRIDQM